MRKKENRWFLCAISPKCSQPWPSTAIFETATNGLRKRIPNQFTTGNWQSAVYRRGNANVVSLWILSWFKKTYIYRDKYFCSTHDFLWCLMIAKNKIKMRRNTTSCYLSIRFISHYNGIWFDVHRWRSICIGFAPKVHSLIHQLF